MADPILPARFASQPQYNAAVDRGNPITKGLLVAYSGGIEHSMGAVALSPGSSQLKVTPAGLGFNALGASDYVDFGPVFNNTGPCTLFVLLVQTSYTPAVGSFNNTISAGDRCSIRAGLDGSTPGVFYTYNGATWNEVTIQRLFPLGASAIEVGVHTGSNNLLYLWDAANGISSATAACSARVATSQPLRLGTDSETARSFTGQIPLALAWDRALSSEEITSLINNPWQVFKAPAPRLWPQDVAGGDVTLALTGQSITSAAGTLGVTHDQAASGSAATASPGTLIPANVLPLAGTAATASPGTLGVTHDQALAGTAATGSAGTVVPANSIPASGQAGTVSPGTVAPATSVPLSGQAITGAQGNVSAGNDVTVALTGQAVTVSAGTLAPSNTKALAGDVTTAAAGTVVAANDKALTGSAATSSAGTILPSNVIPITGGALTGAQGTVTAQAGSNVTVALTGQGITSALGTLVVPVFETESPHHYTVNVTGSRLGPAIDNVDEARLGASLANPANNPATRRLGARNK